MISIGLAWHTTSIISRCLALLSCVYPHVRLRCPESSRSELHWRSIGAEGRCDDGAMQVTDLSSLPEMGSHCLCRSTLNSDFLPIWFVLPLSIIWRVFVDSLTILRNDVGSSRIQSNHRD